MIADDEQITRERPRRMTPAYAIECLKQQWNRNYDCDDDIEIRMGSIQNFDSLEAFETVKHENKEAIDSGAITMFACGTPTENPPPSLQQWPPLDDEF